MRNAHGHQTNWIVLDDEFFANFSCETATSEEDEKGEEVAMNWNSN